MGDLLRRVPHDPDDPVGPPVVPAQNPRLDMCPLVGAVRTRNLEMDAVRAVATRDGLVDRQFQPVPFRRFEPRNQNSRVRGELLRVQSEDEQACRVDVQ